MKKKSTIVKDKSAAKSKGKKPAKSRLFDRVNPKKLDVQAVDGFHLGGHKLALSFEVSDEHDERSRSFLLVADFSKDKVEFEVKLDIDECIRSHISYSEDRHEALELGGLIHRLPADGKKAKPLPEGVLTRLFRLDDHLLFAVGERGSYVEKDGTWTYLKGSEKGIINGVHGRPPDSVYACGNSVYFARFKGGQLQTIDLDVEAKFNGVHVAENGSVFLAANKGRCFEYKNSKITRLQAPADLDFFDICEFKGKRYWSASNYGICVQNGNKIEELRVLGNAYTMHASAEYLVIAAWKEFILYDGKNWTGFQFSFNKGPKLKRLKNLTSALGLKE